MTEGKQFVVQQEILVLQIYQEEVSFLTEQTPRIFFIYSSLSPKLLLRRAQTLIFAQVIVLFEGTGKSLSLHEPIRGASVFSQLIFNPEEIAKVSSKQRVLEKGDSDPSRIIVVSSAYCESALNVGYINATNIFILPNGISQGLCLQNEELRGERASLSHSDAIQRKKLRRPSIVLDTTAYICGQFWRILTATWQNSCDLKELNMKFSRTITRGFLIISFVFLFSACFSLFHAL